MIKHILKKLLIYLALFIQANLIYAYNKVYIGIDNRANFVVSICITSFLYVVAKEWIEYERRH